MRIRGFRSTVATSRGVSVQIAGDRMKGECTEMSRISRRHFLATGAAASLARSAQTAGDRPAPPDFVNPPWEARPSTYWVWLNGFTDPRRITYELEELHKAGFNAAYILEIGARAGEGVPAGPAYFGPESLKAIGHAVREAGRLGLDIGVTNSSSWNSGGSWITPEHAAKGLYWTRIPVRGPARFSEVLPFPQLPGAVPRQRRNVPPPGEGESVRRHHRLRFVAQHGCPHRAPGAAPFPRRTNSMPGSGRAPDALPQRDLRCGVLLLSARTAIRRRYRPYPRRVSSRAAARLPADPGADRPEYRE